MSTPPFGMEGPAIDPNLLQLVQQQVQLFKDEAAAPQERVLAVMRLHDKVIKTAAQGTGLRALLQFEGVKLLGNILQTSWPDNADFGSSSCPSDTLVLLAPDLDPQVLGWSVISGQLGRALRGKATALTRSLRRVAADLLADIIDSMAAAEQLSAQGLFGLFHFPIMLTTALERYIYGQTKAEQRDNADQAQQIAERLLSMAATAAQHDQRVATFMASYCALHVCKCYKDYWQVKWEPQHKRRATQAAAAAGRAALVCSNLHSAGSSRIWPDIVPSGVPPAQVKQRLAAWDAEEKYDLMTEAFGTFMIHVVPAAKQEQLLQWVMEADASTKVAHVFSNPLASCLNARCLTAAWDMLAKVWDNHARLLSREMRAARLAGQDARAGRLRASGNEHFKAGRLEAALKDYMAALSETPEDCRLYMNISLMHLKLGHVNEAYDVARSGLAHEPSNSKAWVRLGDACREAGRWQLAALTYKAALDLGAAGDADVMARHDDAVSRLERSWSWTEVPAPWDVAGQAAWLHVGGQAPGHQAGYEHWLRKVQKEINKLHHTSRSIAVKLKVHVLNARALEAAKTGQLARLPALHEWQMSWGDMPMQAPVTGQIRYMVQVADIEASTETDSALTPAPAYLEGQPGTIDCINALALACFHPPNGVSPNKPKSLDLSYRMLTNYEQLRQVFTESWGIPVVIETKTEAQRSAVQYDTHYMGRNFEDMGYKKEALFDIAGCKLPDSHNDHKTAAALCPAAAAAAGSNSGRGKSAGASSSSSGGSARNAAAPAAAAGQANGGKKKNRAQQQQPPQQQPTQPNQPTVHFHEAEDGSLVISMPGSAPYQPGQQQQVRTIQTTLSEHIRQRGTEQGWGAVLGAVSSGRVTQREVQQLSDMVRRL